MHELRYQFKSTRNKKSRRYHACLSVLGTGILAFSRAFRCACLMQACEVGRRCFLRCETSRDSWRNRAHCLLKMVHLLFEMTKFWNDRRRVCWKWCFGRKKVDVDAAEYEPRNDPESGPSKGPRRRRSSLLLMEKNELRLVFRSHKQIVLELCTFHQTTRMIFYLVSKGHELACDDAVGSERQQ